MASRRGQEAERKAEGEDEGYQSLLSLHKDAPRSSERLDDGGLRDDAGSSPSENLDSFKPFEGGHAEGQHHQDRNTWTDDGYTSSRPLGRVFGRAGRRQRVTSSQLQSQNMGKPFEVTIMHDILEGLKDWEEGKAQGNDQKAQQPKEEAPPKDIVLMPAEPTAEEVHDSIEALRPATTILEDDELTKLAEELTKRYKTKQLSRYLATTLRLDKIDGDPIQVTPRPSDQGAGGVQRSFWHTGRSPIEVRVGASQEIRKRAPRNRKAVVQQILSVAWNLKSSTELQSIGELELLLTSWQFKYLFSLTAQGAPMHLAMVTTHFLRKTAEIRPYEPESILRIVARQGDAQEIADQIDLGLREIVSVDTDLSVFKSVLGPSYYKARLERRFSASLCADIGRRTSTIIELVDRNRLVIHGKTQEDVHYARRAMLLFLDLPSQSSFESHELVLPAPGTTQSTVHGEQRAFALESSASRLDLRHRHLRLGREIIGQQAIFGTGQLTPSLNKSKAASSTLGNPKADSLHRFKDDKHLEKYLNSLPPFMPFRDRPAGAKKRTWLWQKQQIIKPSRWRVVLGKRLAQSYEQRHAPVTDDVSTSPGAPQPTVVSILKTSSVLEANTPDQARLLSYFDPRNDDDGICTHKYLHAHFIPSPFGKGGVDNMRSLPRIEVVYDMSLPEGFESPLRIAAKLSRQEAPTFAARRSYRPHLCARGGDPRRDGAIGLSRATGLPLESKAAEAETAVL